MRPSLPRHPRRGGLEPQQIEAGLEPLKPARLDPLTALSSITTGQQPEDAGR